MTETASTTLSTPPAGMSWIGLTPTVKGTECASWCVAELPGDSPATTLHISDSHRVHVTSPCGRDVNDVAVMLEASRESGTAVRIQGAGDAPMTPAQALTLAHELILAAREAYGIPR